MLKTFALKFNFFSTQLPTKNIWPQEHLPLDKKHSK